MNKSRGRWCGWLAAAIVAALLGACAHPTGTVVLLPEKDGRDTAVTVKQGEREIVLDKPYAAVETRTDAPRTFTSTPEQVEARFGAALGAQPSRPNSFTLYFIDNSDQLTDASKPIFAGALADIAKHQVPDIVVVGHTDTVGSDAANDALALRRAQSVRAVLIAQGLPAASIVAVGRGKRELLVPTGDNVAEPRNRRVEVIVR